MRAKGEEVWSHSAKSGQMRFLEAVIGVGPATRKFWPLAAQEGNC